MSEPTADEPQRSSRSVPTNRRCRVVGLGVVVVDFLAVLDHYPQIDTKTDITQSLIQVGGPVPTALAQLSRFGHDCHFIGNWSDDPLGQLIRTDLDSCRIGIEACEIATSGQTGHSQVWVERSTGARTSVTQRPATFTLSSEMKDLILHTDCLLLDGWPSRVSSEAARLARSNDVRVCVDTGSPKPQIDDVLAAADIVNMPLRFVQQRFETDDPTSGGKLITERGAKWAVVTDGERGATLVSQEGIWRAEAMPLESVIDTNGAGDVFSAGLVHAALLGFSADDALRVATAASGLKCQHLGNRAALADWSAVLQETDSIVVLPH